MKKVAVSEEEKKLSYYKYYERPLAEIPQEKLDIWNGAPADPKSCIKFEDSYLPKNIRFIYHRWEKIQCLYHCNIIC